MGASKAAEAKWACRPDPRVEPARRPNASDVAMQPSIIRANSVGVCINHTLRQAMEGIHTQELTNTGNVWHHSR